MGEITGAIGELTLGCVAGVRPGVGALPFVTRSENEMGEGDA